MDYIDKLKPDMRLLVHEYGALIVADMIAEGYHDPATLRPVLEAWRSKRQQQWLDTDYITRGSSTRRNFERALGDGQGR